MGNGIAWLNSSGWSMSFLVVVLASTLPASSLAQTVSVGVRGGPSLVGVLWEDPYAADGMGVVSTTHGGVVVAVGLSRRFAVEADLLWSRKGFGDRGGAHIGTVKSDYLELPLLLRFRLPTRLSPHLLAGPTTAVQLRCRVTEVAGTGSAGCGDPLIGLSQRKLDFGAVIGFGLSYPAGAGSLFLDALGDLGLRDFKSEPLPPGYARNLAIHVSLGFTVPIGGAGRTATRNARMEGDA